MHYVLMIRFSLLLFFPPLHNTTWTIGLVTPGDGYVYAIGGNITMKNSIDRYDPKTNTWEFFEECVGVGEYYDRESLALVPLDGLLYFIGKVQGLG